jgi:hypothetical protein
MTRMLLFRYAVLLLLVWPGGEAVFGQAASGPDAAVVAPAAETGAGTQTPDAPQPAGAKTLQARPALAPAQQRAAQNQAPVYLINGAPYVRPTTHDLFVDYANDTYLLNGFVRSTVRALYTQARDEPDEWGTDIAGYGQRYASSEGITVINGNVRLGMELLFHEDLRYYPCRGCSIKRKIGNALLAEFTARHDSDGHRFFTLTPVISDFSGPIIAHSVWYPNYDPFGGVVATRTVFATRVGLHLFQEFRPHRHHRHLEVSTP